MIDTGSDWNAAGIQHLAGIFHLRQEQLHPPTREMKETRTANDAGLKCAGYIDAEFTWNGKSTNDRVVFFHSFPNVLFSLNLLTTLGIVTINSESQPSPSILLPYGDAELIGNRQSSAPRQSSATTIRRRQTSSLV